MKRMLWGCLLVLGLMLGWTLVHAADFYVIPVKKCCTCKGTLNGTRWCDNWDGTVTDMTTCLVWLKFADWGGNWPWRSNTPDDYDDAHTQAGLLCDGTVIRENPKPPFYIYLNDGSVVGDWRLPTMTELLGIRIGDEPVSIAQPRAFVDVTPGPYWSSTTSDSNTSMARAVNFELTGAGWAAKIMELRVWPVRDGN